MKTNVSITRAALATACLLLSTTAHAIDLMGAWQKAAAYDPSLQAATEAVAAGREKAVQGDSRLKPQVALQGAYQYVDSRSASDLPPAVAEVLKPDSAGTVYQAGIKLTQPLYDAAAVADRAQLREQSTLAETRYRGTQQDRMQRVAEAYFDVLLAQENLRVVLAEKAAIGRQRERAQARFEVGRGRITDVQETQARYDAVLTKEVSALSGLALREAQFQELTGVPALALAPIRDDIAPVPPQPDNLLAWQQRGADRNARVLSRRSEVALATAEIGRWKLSGRPTVDVVASYTYKGQNGGLSPLVAADNQRSAVVGVQVTIPLYAGGALDSRERESLAKRREADHELSAALRDTRLQVQDAFLAVKTGVSRIAALAQSVRSAGTALEATTLGRDVGQRTELDVLDAQQRLFSAQLDLAQARNDYLIGRIRLAAATGELQDDDLRAVNAYLAH